MKHEGPAFVAFMTGITVLAGHFFQVEKIAQWSAQLVRWRIIVAAFALVLGGVNMLRFHGGTILRGKKNKIYSAIFLISFLTYFLLGVIKSPTSKEYQFIWEGLYQPASSTMYSFTLFYMTSACWRAFRIRNAEAAVLMITGALVLLGQVGIGSAISPAIPLISSWIIDVPNAAAIRAITIGGSLGMVVMSLRVILGMERTYMAGGQE